MLSRSHLHLAPIDPRCVGSRTLRVQRARWVCSRTLRVVSGVTVDAMPDMTPTIPSLDPRVEDLLGEVVSLLVGTAELQPIEIEHFESTFREIQHVDAMTRGDGEANAERIADRSSRRVASMMFRAMIAAFGDINWERHMDAVSRRQPGEEIL